MRKNAYPTLLLSLAWSFTVSPTAHGDDSHPSKKEIRESVTKSIALLQRSAEEFTEHRACFSCHHQAMPMIAVATAKQHGFKVDEELLKKQTQHTMKFVRRSKNQFNSGRGTGGQVDTAGYILWTLEEAEYESDEFTSAVTTYLLKRNKKLDHWKTTSNRPPSEASVITTNYLAIRGLSAYGTDKQGTDISNRMAQIQEWIKQVKADDTEDHVFLLQTLLYVEGSDQSKQEVGKALLALQRDDGGWAQKSDMKSDAYAPGSALAALVWSGSLKVGDKAYRKGLAWLLKDQKDDGSWHVVSRSKPFQKYFETGFPHKKDQFISAAASSWATVALALAVEKSENRK